MDGTIPLAAGQWVMDTVGSLLNWPGLFGWGVITGWVGPGVVRWAAKSLPKRK